MSTRVRNPEIYVKGYGKNTTKDDLKSWFKEFGKIICIQYKGPYSFIVNHHHIQEFEDYYDAEAAVKEMNDKKVEGFRLIVEPSGKKRFGGGNRSRSRSRDNKKKHSRRRRYPVQNSVLHHQAPLLPHQGAQVPLHLTRDQVLQ